VRSARAILFNFGDRIVELAAGFIADHALKVIVKTHGGVPLSAALSAPLLSQPTEVFLSGLKGRNLGSGGAFGIHREQEGPDDNASYASRDVLGHLKTLFVGELGDLLVVRLDLGGDHHAVAGLIMRLNHCDGLWIATRAAGDENCGRRRGKCA
jgi:hypothetical protein